MTPSLHNVLVVNDDNKECVKLMSRNKQIPGEKPSFLEQKPQAKQKKAGGGGSGAGP